MPRDLENAKKLRKAWYERNKELTKERARQWALNNPDKRKQSIDKWREENREQHNATNRDWNSRNQDKKTALQAKRRAAKLLRTPKWLTEDNLWIIKEAYSLAADRTKLHGFPWHVDHIFPLQGKNVSGLHVPLNIQVIPAVENIKKSNKHAV